MKITSEKFEEIKSYPFFRGRVITESMSPVIKVGDKIVVDVGQMDIKRFDIVVFYHQEKLICHFVWHFNKLITPLYLQTRSLSGSTDYPVEINHYLGKVISHKLSLWRKLKLLVKEL